MEYTSPASSVFPSPAPVAEYFSPAPVVLAENTVPYVEQDTDEEEEELVDYCSGVGVFLEKLDDRWQFRGVGSIVLLRDSQGAKFFQFWQNERLLADDVIQRIGDTVLVLRPARTWRWEDPDDRHAVRFASPELARKFHEEWMGLFVLFWCRQPSAALSHFHAVQGGFVRILCPWLACVAFHAQEYKCFFFGLRLVVLVSEHLKQCIIVQKTAWFQRCSSCARFLTCRLYCRQVVVETVLKTGASTVSVLCHGGQCPCCAGHRQGVHFSGLTQRQFQHSPGQLQGREKGGSVSFQVLFGVTRGCA